MENEKNIINNEPDVEVVEENNEVTAETEYPIISETVAESETTDETVAYAPEFNYGAYVDNSKKQKKTGLIIGIVCALVAFVMVIVVGYSLLFSPMAKYNRAENLLEKGRYEEAISIFEGLEDYKDSSSRITECNKRMLLAYCEENGTVDMYSSDGTYELSAQNGSLVITQIMRSDSVTSETNFILDMDSNNATFDVTIGSYISGSGTFNTSEISLLDAPVTAESDSIYITDSQIEEYVSLALRVTCYEINPLIELTGLDLDAADIGFTKID